jgi:hypothetical protein
MLNYMEKPEEIQKNCIDIKYGLKFLCTTLTSSILQCEKISGDLCLKYALDARK